MKLKIFLLLIIAFVLRLININQSLWLDEAITARVVQQYSYLDIVKQFSPYDFHPPFYYLFMKFWTGIFGYLEISLRMPSVIFSLITGWIIYLIGKKIKNEKIGFWASLFFLFNPLIIYYSQEARMYMMNVFFITGGLYYFLKIQNLKVKSQNYKEKFKNYLLMNSLFSLSFITFYGSIFFIISILLYFSFKKQWKNFFVSLFIILFSLFITYPLFSQQLTNAKFSLMAVKNWSLVLGKANLKNLLLIPIKFSIGRIDFYPKWIYYLVALSWTIFVFIKTFLIRDSLLIYLFVFPLILGFFVSFFTPLLQYFRFLYLISLLSLILSISVYKKKIIKLILFFGFFIFSLVYLFIPQFHREDWKNLIKSLPKDKSIYMILSSSDPIRYYNKNLLIKELRTINQDIKDKEVFIIPYASEIYGFDYKKILEKKRYKLFEKKTVRGLYLERWINLRQ